MEEGLPPIEVVDEIGSTNEEMKARCRAGAGHGAALRARVQTAGRGQRSHTWSSPRGGLYLSVLIRPDVSADALPALPIVCALGALGALRDAGCSLVRLKWPNDIVVGGHKLAGVLTELVTTKEGVYAVCGIGVNMETTPTPAGTWPASALPPTSLANEMAPGMHCPTPAQIADDIRSGMLSALAAWSAADRWNRAHMDPHRPTVRISSTDTARWFEDPVRGGAEGPLAPLLVSYNAALAFVGKTVRVMAIDGPEMARGTFLGVDGYGHALIVQEDGTVSSYNAVDALIRPA